MIRLLNVREDVRGMIWLEDIHLIRLSHSLVRFDLVMIVIYIITFYRIIAMLAYHFIPFHRSA
jgi:hypothetical protein